MNKPNCYIVMKRGHKKSNANMDNIQGISIPMINGKRFLLYPKFCDLPLLRISQINKCETKQLSYTKALYSENNHEETSLLLKAESPAAQFTRSFGMDIPSTMMNIALCKYENEISLLCKQINGAMDIKKISSFRWSSSRCSTHYAWYCNSLGTFGSYYCDSSFTVSCVKAL